MSPASTLNISAGLLLYVQDPLNPGSYIPENDPRYAVVESWMGTQKEDSILRANALSNFNREMADWQTNAKHCDELGIKRPDLPAIPTVEVDQVIAEPDGSYAIKTTFQPVASYPDPLIPVQQVSAGTGPGFLAAERAAAPPPAPSPDVAALMALVQQLLAALAAQKGVPA